MIYHNGMNCDILVFMSKKIVNKISFLQAYPMLVDIFPLPEPASKSVPDWWRQQPSIMGEDPKTPENGSLKLTVKKCQAFFDCMSMGYMLKMPIDIYIDTTEEKFDIQIPIEMQRFRNELITGHAAEQVSNMAFDKNRYCNQIFRVHPSWMVSTPKGYSTLFTNPMHQPPSPLKAVEAIIDTDKMFSDGHLSFFVEKNFKGVIKQGTPIVQVFPFKRDDWEMEVVENFPKEKIELQRKIVRSVFQNGYRMKLWVKKNFK